MDASANRVHVRSSPRTRAVAGNRTLTTDVRSPSWDVAGYALGDYRVGRVTLSGGFRYDYIRIPFRDQLDPAADTTNSFQRLSPRAGLSVELGARRERLRLGGSELSRAGGPRARLRRRDRRLPAALRARATTRRWTRWCRPPSRPGRSWCAGRRSSPPRSTAPPCATTSRSSSRPTPCSKASSRTSATRGAKARSWAVQVLPSEAVSLYANYAFTRATFQDPAEIFSIRADDQFAASPLAGPNEVEAGDRLPLIPAHQVKAGGLVRLPAGADVGLDLRYTGHQWLRGDEANETAPLGGYFSASVRAGLTRGAGRSPRSSPTCSTPVTRYSARSTRTAAPARSSASSRRSAPARSSSSSAADSAAEVPRRRVPGDPAHRPDPPPRPLWALPARLTAGEDICRAHRSQYRSRTRATRCGLRWPAR